jgi:hypothetical protein
MRTPLEGAVTLAGRGQDRDLALDVGQCRIEAQVVAQMGDPASGLGAIKEQREREPDAPTALGNGVEGRVAVFGSDDLSVICGSLGIARLAYTTAFSEHRDVM